MDPEISRRLHAIREGVLAPDSAKAQQIMTLAFQQDPLLSARILDGVGESHLRKPMVAAGMDKVSMDLALRQQQPDDPSAIPDPFLAPEPARSGQQIEAERKKRAAADPKDDIRAPIEDRAPDYMDDMLMDRSLSVSSEASLPQGVKGILEDQGRRRAAVCAG